jgi:hypothetical protein
MSQQHEKPSLAHGSPLSRDSWSDFVARLRHDCVGEGVRNHHTADAIFKVEARKIVYGIDRDYTDKQAVICDDSTWFSPQEYWDDLGEEEQAQLNKIAQHWHECDFLELDESDQWDQLDDIDDHRVVGWEEEWEYACSHFTKDAAEAFIERKRHDYRKGIRVYVDDQTYCWEYNTIKAGILDGHIGLVDKNLAEAYQFLAAEYGRIMLQAGFSESAEAAQQDAMSWIEKRPAVDVEGA